MTSTCLEERTAIVTGAAQGVGYAVAGRTTASPTPPRTCTQSRSARTAA